MTAPDQVEIHRRQAPAPTRLRVPAAQDHHRFRPRPALHHTLDSILDRDPPNQVGSFEQCFPHDVVPVANHVQFREVMDAVRADSSRNSKPNPASARGTVTWWSPPASIKVPGVKTGPVECGPRAGRATGPRGAAVLSS